jgi:hypothetical protein
MKHRVPLIMLTVCLVGLCLFGATGVCFFGEKTNSVTVSALNRFAGTAIGCNAVRHYLFQHSAREGDRVFSPNLPEERKYYLIAKAMFAAAAAFFTSIISMCLFVFYARNNESSGTSTGALKLAIMLIILNGTAIRLILAFAYFGNADMASYEIVADIAGRGGNVYAETSRYNYSPLWFFVLRWLKSIQRIFPLIPFFAVVRSFLCCVDLVALAGILMIAAKKKLSLERTCLFFYLNPVSFLITGYHGQFENMAIAMLILGLLGYISIRNNRIRCLVLWVGATVGLLIKHNIFYELIICLNASIRRYWVKILLFGISSVIFLASFIPYWKTGSAGIIDNVFKYSSIMGYYGIMTLCYCPALKYPFVLGLFLFPLLIRKRDIFSQCLLGLLFFMSFSTGMAIQYFILPIALGALRPTRGFFVYTLVVGAYVLGTRGNVFVPGLHMLQWNTVWFASLYWFVHEYRNGPDVGAAEAPLAGLAAVST